jgi:glyoxylase-like metal-dependent hydrolase (beta-lactamase superfamily II)
MAENQQSSQNEIRQFVVGPIQTNCYAFVSDGECMVVDPGDSGADIADRLDDVDVRLIVATHGHGDHVSGVAALKEETDAPFAMSAEDREMATHATQTSRFADEDAPEPDRILKEGDTIHIGSADFEVIAAPGHTPGGLVLLGQGIAFVGDTIFAGSAGRTDLPGGDPQVMKQTLARLRTLIPPKTVLLCGHNAATTMERELVGNPWLNGQMD